VTDLAPLPTRPDGATPSPPARRLARPRWRDSRLLIGILLVLISVVLGVRFVAVADRTQSWLVASRPLPAGHVVTRDDLTSVRAHLADATAGSYYLTDRANGLVGAELAKPVAKGELVAAGDFVRGRGTPTRVVPVLVDSGRVPSLRPGDHVDVYVYQRAGTVQGGQGTAAGTTGTETLVLHDVEYLDGDQLSNGDRSLKLRVPVDAAIAAVAASQSQRVDVVLVERGPRGDEGGAGPTSAPGYGS
jgi:Flp pilus assembly protein CpaB